MNAAELKALVNQLVGLPSENEWLEFKHNFHSPEEIGERISALSNGACLLKQPHGYLIYGVLDTQEIVGTAFKAKSHKKGNEDLEHWLAQRLSPRIDFEVYEFDYDEHRHISLYIIPAAKNQPVSFIHVPYIRVGSITRQLNEFPEKEAKIWRNDTIAFEKEIAKANLNATDIISLLSTQTYFDLLKLPYPSNQSAVIERFKIDDKNAAIASRIIKDTFEAGKIKEDDPDNKSRKHRSYVPFWA
jgi:ATP-dependent DNA helicase RecG